MDGKLAKLGWSGDSSVFDSHGSQLKNLFGRRWHLLTGVAVYIYIVIVEYATADHDGQKIMNGSRKYAWPVSSMLHNDEKSTINRER